MADEDDLTQVEGAELPEEKGVNDAEVIFVEPREVIVQGDCPTCPTLAPAWMATFADMATLLMAFFVLILSFTEMEDPSIYKEVSGSMSNAFGVQREVPSVEPPMAQNIVAKNFKTAKTKPTPIVNVREETSDEDPRDVELKSTATPERNDNESEVEYLKRALKSQIARGLVEVEEQDGNVKVNVVQKTENGEESQFDQDLNKGLIDEDTLEVFAKVAEAQSYMESLVEVEFNQADTESIRLKEREAEEAAEDQLRKIRADLRSEISSGLANVERIGNQILIQLSTQGSFRSGFAELQTGFIPTLRNVAQAVSESVGSVTISGHTDNVPIAFSERFDSNWDLSAARAAAVADFMIENSIDDSRLTVLGFADTKPVTTNDTPQGRQQNRRIEILIDS
jgi:chemotaxis protein MotB